jgi:hypothetical protein
MHVFALDVSWEEVVALDYLEELPEDALNKNLSLFLWDHFKNHFLCLLWF